MVIEDVRLWQRAYIRALRSGYKDKSASIRADNFCYLMSKRAQKLVSAK